MCQETSHGLRLLKTLSFKWGNESHQIGFSEDSFLTPRGAAHQGPSGFAVNPLNKDICIIDVVNGALKIYNIDAAFLYEIPVDGLYNSVICEIAYDNEGHLWLHHDYDQYVNKYSASGDVIRHIDLSKSDSQGDFGRFSVQNNMEFLLVGRHYIIDGSPGDRNTTASCVNNNYHEPGSATMQTNDVNGTIYFNKKSMREYCYFTVIPAPDSTDPLKLLVFDPALSKRSTFILGEPNIRNGSGFEVINPVQITHDDCVFYMKCDNSEITITVWELREQ